MPARRPESGAAARGFVQKTSIVRLTHRELGVGLTLIRSHAESRELHPLYPQVEG